MHSRYIIILGLLLFKIYTFSEQNNDFEFEKVAVWAETYHHINTQAKNSLILIYLDNTCSIFKKSYPKRFQN